jgi:hypothetical protein
MENEDQKLNIYLLLLCIISLWYSQILTAIEVDKTKEIIHKISEIDKLQNDLILNR